VGGDHEEELPITMGGGGKGVHRGGRKEKGRRETKKGGGIGNMGNLYLRRMGPSLGGKIARGKGGEVKGRQKRKKDIPTGQFRVPLLRGKKESVHP